MSVKVQVIRPAGVETPGAVRIAEVCSLIGRDAVRDQYAGRQSRAR